MELARLRTLASCGIHRHGCECLSQRAHHLYRKSYLLHPRRNGLIVFNFMEHPLDYECGINSMGAFAVYNRVPSRHTYRSRPTEPTCSLDQYRYRSVWRRPVMT